MSIQGIAIPRAVPQPGFVHRPQELIRRDSARDEYSAEREVDRDVALDRQKRQLQKSVPSFPTVTLDGQTANFNRGVYLNIITENDQRSLTTADVLMRLINQMGGGERIPRPGQLLDIVI